MSTLNDTLEIEQHEIKLEFECFVSSESKSSQCVGLAAGELKGAVSAHRYLEAQKVWCEKSIKKTKAAHATADVLQAKAGRDLYRFINQNVQCSSLILNKLTQAASEAEAVYKFQFYLHTEQQSNVSFTPHCMPEGRLLLQGEEIVIGIAYADAPGRTLKDKIAQIYDMSMQGDKGLLDHVRRTRGFFLHCKADAPRVVAIPAGYIVINLTTSKAFGLRWSFVCSKHDYQTITDCQDALVTAYPEANTLQLQALRTLIDAEVEEE